MMIMRIEESTSGTVMKMDILFYELWLIFCIPYFSLAETRKNTITASRMT